VSFLDDPEVAIPAVWRCRQHGRESERSDGAEAPKAKPQRTHWDMLLERRSIPELQALLEERLTLLHQMKGVRQIKR
jgi:hypothetical protein